MSAFDDIPAGPELDWLVLHHVLDWKPALEAPYTAPIGGKPGAPREVQLALWPVSTDWTQAGKVAEALLERGLEVTVVPDGQGHRATLRGDAGEATALGDTPALAFCRAVMKAMEAVLITKG